MIPQKPKRDHVRTARHSRQNRRSLILGVMLAVLMFFPVMHSGAGGMNREQWVDLALVMVMFCCAIALLYQLGLAAIDQGLREPEFISQPQDDESAGQDIVNR